jgi:hypothetical protein
MISAMFKGWAIVFMLMAVAKCVLFLMWCCSPSDDTRGRLWITQLLDVLHAALNIICLMANGLTIEYMFILASAAQTG